MTQTTRIRRQPRRVPAPLSPERAVERERAAAVRKPDPAELADCLISEGPLAPATLTTLAGQLAFYREDAERRARAELTGTTLAEVLKLIPLEVGYIHARSAGESVAEAASIDLDAVDYFGAPLSTAELALRKRKATVDAKRLVHRLLAEPLDPSTYDAIRFAEGLSMVPDYLYDDCSPVSQAVYDEVGRIMASWETA